MDDMTPDTILMSAAEWGRWAAAQRKAKAGNCRHCGRAFVTIGRRLFCSNACRQASYEAGCREKRRKL